MVARYGSAIKELKIDIVDLDPFVTGGSLALQLQSLWIIPTAAVSQHVTWSRL